MIKAKHNIIAEGIYRTFVSRLLKYDFDSFILQNEIPLIDINKGLILTPNHISWWDGFLADYVMRRFSDRRPYIMMLESQLKKYKFFKYTGAFSIEPSSMNSVRESLDYARRIADSHNDYLIFYPQGEIQLHENNFVKIKRGLISIAEKTDANIQIVSFKIFFQDKRKPSVSCRFGSSIPAHKVASDYDGYERLFLQNIEDTDRGVFCRSGKDLLRK